MSGLTDADRESLREAIDRDECGPGDYNTTEHAFATVEAIVQRAVAAALTEAADAIDGWRENAIRSHDPCPIERGRIPHHLTHRRAQPAPSPPAPISRGRIASTATSGPAITQLEGSDMSDTSSSNAGGIGLGGALFLVFLVLKLTDTIDWSWWWVTAPLWIPAAFALAIFAVIGTIALAGSRR